MFNPGGFLSDPWLLWMMVVPAIPLIIAVTRRLSFNLQLVSLILYCTVLIMLNLFTFITRHDETLSRITQNINQLAEYIFSMFLLFTCLSNRYLRYLALGFIITYLAVFIVLGLTIGYERPFAMVIKTGYLIVFLTSITGLVMMFKEVVHKITTQISFWLTAGLFFQYGLFTLFFTFNSDQQAENLVADPYFGSIYLIIIFTKFILFSIGVSIHKQLGTR